MTTTLHDTDLLLISGFLRGIKPDPIITVSEWADANHYLPATAAESGKYRTSRTPYAKEIMDRLSVTDPAQKVIFKKGSQIGATEMGNIWSGYNIDVAPAPLLFVMPTDNMMKDTSKNRIQKMIDIVPRVNSRMKPVRSKDSGNTLLYKEYEGGFMKLVGANSPVGLASTAVRYAYMDEIDRYPANVGGEGSALGLAETRTATFGARKKLFLTSTPTIKNASAIDAAFEETSQRFYHVPCPHCKQLQVLNFEQFRYDPVTIKISRIATYECFYCKQQIEERRKTWMLANGVWIAKFPERENGLLYGYHLSAIYSPYGWYSWGQMAYEYEKSRGDIPEEIVFANTKLGECYEGKQGEKPDWEALYDRAHNEKELYHSNKPFREVVYITAGVDIQADRIEVELVGWMKGKISQQIDYRVLLGNTDNDEVWQQLAEIISETWLREDNQTIPLKMMAVDTGYNTKKAYEFVKKFPLNQVIAIKGRDKLDLFVSAPKTVEYNRAGKKIGKSKVFNIGVSIIKTELYGFLKRRIDKETGEIPNGFCYFPVEREPSYFRSITAEEITQVVNRRGYTEYVWVKKYERNEALDCRVYARAAAYVLGIDRWTDDRWEKELLHSGTPVNVPAATEAAKPKQEVKKKNNNKLTGGKSIWG